MSEKNNQNVNKKEKKIKKSLKEKDDEDISEVEDGKKKQLDENNIDDIKEQLDENIENIPEERKFARCREEYDPSLYEECTYKKDPKEKLKIQFESEKNADIFVRY